MNQGNTMSDDLPDPSNAPELFDGVLLRRAAAWLIDCVIITFITIAALLVGTVFGVVTLGLGLIALPIIIPLAILGYYAATLGSPSHAITASDKDKVSDFVVSMALSGRAAVSRARAVRRAVRISRSMGSAALALAYVANGRFDAFVQQGGLSAWDIAAAGLIAERGGATVTNLAGEPWFDLARKPRSIGILAAPAAHHPELLRLVRK